MKRGSLEGAGSCVLGAGRAEAAARGRGAAAARGAARALVGWRPREAPGLGLKGGGVLARPSVAKQLGAVGGVRVTGLLCPEHFSVALGRRGLEGQKGGNPLSRRPARLPRRTV